MKGVILAGGFGSRLLPLTKVTNKHLLPIYNRPMIFYPIDTLRQAGIEDILIISGTEHCGHFLQLLGDGSDFGANFSYRIQAKPGGIAHALKLAKDFVESDFAVILGDNIFEDHFRFSAPHGAKVFLKEVNNPNRFGVALIEDSKIVHIEEKPKIPSSKLAVTGLYLYDQSVFDIIDELKPSSRGELEITDVNNRYIALGQMSYQLVTGAWTDAGTFESLFAANCLIERMYNSQ